MTNVFANVHNSQQAVRKNGFWKIICVFLYIYICKMGLQGVGMSLFLIHPTIGITKQKSFRESES